MAWTDNLTQFTDAFKEYPIALIGVFVLGVIIGWIFMGKKR